MLIDDRKKFVELTIDAIMCEKVRYDMQFYTVTDGRDLIRTVNRKIGKWIHMRKDQETKEFQELTEDLFLEFVSSRSGQILLGELNDDGMEKENLVLKDQLKEFTSNIIKLEVENRKLYEDNITLSNELKDLKNIVDSYEKAV